MKTDQLIMNTYKKAKFYSRRLYLKEIDCCIFWSLFISKWGSMVHFRFTQIVFHCLSRNCSIVRVQHFAITKVVVRHFWKFNYNTIFQKIPKVRGQGKILYMQQEYNTAQEYTCRFIECKEWVRGCVRNELKKKKHVLLRFSMLSVA